MTQSQNVATKYIAKNTKKKKKEKDTGDNFTTSETEMIAEWSNLLQQQPEDDEDDFMPEIGCDFVFMFSQFLIFFCLPVFWQRIAFLRNFFFV